MPENPLTPEQIEASWQKMNTILDKEMPKRKRTILWLVIGVFLLSSFIAGFYLKNQAANHELPITDQSNQEIIAENLKNKTESVKKPNEVNGIKKEVVDETSNSIELMKNEMDVNEHNSFSSRKSKGLNLEVEPFSSILMSEETSVPINSSITSETKAAPNLSDEITRKNNNGVTEGFDEITKNDVEYLTRLTPLRFKQYFINRNQPHFTIDITSALIEELKPIEHFQLLASTRIDPSFDANLFLGIGREVSLGKRLYLLPSISLGLDNFNELSINESIANVENLSLNNSGVPTNSFFQSIENPSNRNIHLSPELGIYLRLANSLDIGTSLEYRASLGNRNNNEAGVVLNQDDQENGLTEEDASLSLMPKNQFFLKPQVSYWFGNRIGLTMKYALPLNNAAIYNVVNSNSRNQFSDLPEIKGLNSELRLGVKIKL